jgi:predicted TIM-barrel fold metal-dependent hydrolase
MIGLAATMGLASLPGSSLAEEKEPPMIPGPDPATRMPAFRAPAGAVDCHTHIFGPPEIYPYAAKRPYTAPPAPLAMFQELHARIGIERAVLVNATLHGTDNRVVLDAIAQNNGRYLGVAVIDESFGDKALEALHQGGIRGCRLVFLSRLGGTPDLGRIERIAERIAGLGWHIDLYFEAIHIDDFLPVLERLPVPYVIDHMGAWKAADGIDHPAFGKLVDLLRRDQKCWMKITGPERMTATGAPFHDTVPFARRLIEAAPDRVIWGTDWPHPNVTIMPNDGDLVDLIPLYAPDEAMRHRLLIDNPERLFGFAKR